MSGGFLACRLTFDGLLSRCLLPSLFFPCGLAPFSFRTGGRDAFQLLSGSVLLLPFSFLLLGLGTQIILPGQLLNFDLFSRRFVPGGLLRARRFQPHLRQPRRFALRVSRQFGLPQSIRTLLFSLEPGLLERTITLLLFGLLLNDIARCACFALLRRGILLHS